MRFALSETVDLPADEVFTLISDFGRTLPKIDPDMHEVSKLSEGEIGVGTEWEERFTGPLRRSTVVRSEVVTFEPPRLLRVKFYTTGLNGTIEFNCVAVNEESSRLTLTMDASPTLLGWLAYPLSRRDVRMREAVRISNFKRLAESGEL